MPEKLEYWEQEDLASFLRIKDGWHKKLQSDTVKNLQQEIFVALEDDRRWKQDVYGNWILSFSDIYVYDENGNKMEYQIAVCNDTLPSEHRALIRQLTEASVGKTTECDFLGSGTRAWAGKLNFGSWELACLYMHEIDITGVERLSHTNLLSIALGGESDIQVAKPIYATTNFFVAPFIAGSRPDVIKKQIAESRLNRLRDDFLDFEIPWQAGIKIDSNMANFRETCNGKTYCIDPVYRRGKFL